MSSSKPWGVYEEDPDDCVFGIHSADQLSSTKNSTKKNDKSKFQPISYNYDGGRPHHHQQQQQKQKQQPNHQQEYRNDRDRNNHHNSQNTNHLRNNSSSSSSNIDNNKQSTKNQITKGFNQSKDSLQTLPFKGAVITPGSTLSVNKLASTSSDSKKTLKTIEGQMNSLNSTPSNNKTNYNSGYSVSASDVKSRISPSSNITSDLPYLQISKPINKSNNNTKPNTNPHRSNYNPYKDLIPGKSLDIQPSNGNISRKNNRNSTNVKYETQSKKRHTEDLTNSPEPKKSPRLSNRTPKVPEIVDLLDDSDDDGVNDDDDEKMDIDSDSKKNIVEKKFGQPPVFTVSINNLYVNEICKTNGTAYSVKVSGLLPDQEIHYITDEKSSIIIIPLNLIEKINYGHCVDSDDLGFIELTKLSMLEESGGLEKDLIIAKTDNIDLILEQLRKFIDRNDCFNEITDHNEIKTIMSVDFANKLYLEESNPKKRRSRRSSAVSFAENPEDAEIFIVYPIEIDASDPINITKGCMKRLEEGEYLNDNLIDYKIKVMLEELKKKSEMKRKKIHAFSCQFYIKLTEKRTPKEMFEMVARWTKEIDIFELDFLFIPVNIGSHWSLSVIVRPGLVAQSDWKELKISKSRSIEEIDNLPCILFMDSLNLHNMNTISRQLRSYIEFEYNVKKLKIGINSINLVKKNNNNSNNNNDNNNYDNGKNKLVLNIENFPVIKCTVPQQPNGTDCGVYVIRFFQLIIETWPNSGKTQYDEKMKEYIRRDSFEHDEIVNMRLNIKEEIKSLKGIILLLISLC